MIRFGRYFDGCVLHNRGKRLRRRERRCGQRVGPEVRGKRLVRPKHRIREGHFWLPMRVAQVPGDDFDPWTGVRRHNDRVCTVAGRISAPAPSVVTTGSGSILIGCAISPGDVS